MRNIDTIVVNFNTGELLQRCIFSLIKSNQVATAYVSDNASTDNSADQLSAVVSDSRVHLLKNGANLGFAGGNNRGVPLCNSPFILFINPDCQSNNTALETMLSFLSTHSGVGMVGPLILNEDGTEQRGCRRSEPRPELIFKTLFGRRDGGINQVDTPLPDHPVEVDAISGACMLVRREALEDVGLMDEGYFLHFEDLDWCKRFWLKGWKVMFVPDAVITHFKGGSSRSRPVRVEWHKHKGMIRYYRKFYTQQYSRPFLWSVYAAVWVRYFAMVPIWWIKGMKH